MKKSEMTFWGLMALALAVAIGLLAWAFSGSDRRKAVSDRKVTRISKSDLATKNVRSVSKETERATAKTHERPKAAERKKQGKQEKVRRVVAELPPKEQALSNSVQEALDGDDFGKTTAAALKALSSTTNSEVRVQAINALGWFGDKALVDLTRVMADKDPEVAEAARGQVENALMGLEDDDRAVVLAGEYVNLFAEDEEAVTMFAGVLSSAGMRIIDPDDSDSAEDVAKAKGNRAGIVNIVAEMIGKGGKLEEKGRELYESITGDAWTDRSTADKWANDIEEPKPSESEGQEEAEASAENP